MKKLRTGIEKRIIYTDKEKNENIELSIKVITRLTDIKTDREIIFLNFDENNIFQNQFLLNSARTLVTLALIGC